MANLFPTLAGHSSINASHSSQLRVEAPSNTGPRATFRQSILIADWSGARQNVIALWCLDASREKRLLEGKAEQGGWAELIKLILF